MTICLDLLLLLLSLLLLLLLSTIAGMCITTLSVAAGLMHTSSLFAVTLEAVSLGQRLPSLVGV